MDLLRLLYPWGCLLLILMCSQIKRAEGEVDIRITLLQYNHIEAERADTKCCQNIISYACSTLQKLCNYIFEVCLDSDPRPRCTTATKRTYTPGNTANSFFFDSFAKIQLMLPDRWKGSADLKVVVYDGVDNLVDTLKFTLDTLGNTPIQLAATGLRTSPTNLVLEYTAQVPCGASSNCEEGFSVCDAAGVQSCHPDYVQDGVCKTQKVRVQCQLPDNPSPPVALQGYFNGTHSCNNVPNDLIFFNNRASTEAYIEYIKDGKKFREGLIISQVNAGTFNAAAGRQLLLTTGAPVNISGGQATVGGNLAEFTYTFGSCTVNFTIEPVSKTDLCHGAGQCTTESGIDFCCCDNSFEGAFCEKQTDICTPNPCQAGATCSPVNATDFSCNCSAGYYGKICALTPAAVTCSGQVCSASICQKATPTPPSSCECPPQVTQTCTPSTVQQCPANMYGVNCTVGCVPRDDCLGHYTCDVITGDIICYSGYKGVNCTTRDFNGLGTDPQCPGSGVCGYGGHCFKGQCCCPQGGCEVTTEAQTTEATTTDYMTTDWSSTDGKTTVMGTTGMQTSEMTTDMVTTAAMTTEQPSTEPATSETPTTDAATTDSLTTEPATTDSPTTEPATTDSPTTEPATSETPTTEAQTTEPPTTEPPTTEATTEEVTTPMVTTVVPDATSAVTAAPVTTAAPSISTLAVDNVTLDKLRSLLLQLLGQIASPQTQAQALKQAPQAQALSLQAQDSPSAPVAAQQQNSEPADMTAGEATSYLPCPWTNFRQDDVNSILIFTLNCSARGFSDNTEARIELKYQILAGEIVTQFDFSADDPRVETLLREAVEKALSDNELEVIDTETVAKEEFPYDLRYEFDITGTYLDIQWILNLTVGIQAAFAKKYPNLSNLKVWAPRVVEAIGEDRLSVTLINYWVGVDGDIKQLLKPKEKAAPTTQQLLDAISTEVGFDLVVYTGKIFNYADSFGLFVKGKVFEEDFAKFQSLLQSWWRTDSGVDDYKDVTVIVQRQEKFFGVDAEDNWIVESKLLYFVQLQDESFISGDWFDVVTPSVKELTTEMNFTAANGEDYTILRSTSRRLNATLASRSGSTEKLVREKETYGLYIRGRFANNAKLITAIESTLTSLFSGSVNLTNAIVLGSEELIGEGGETYTRINTAVIYNQTAVDARRIESLSPNAEVITTAIGAVSRTNGEAYEFVTDAEVIKKSVSMESSFTKTIQGSVTVQDYANFEKAIFAGLLETNPDIEKSSTILTIRTGMEMVSQQGTTLTTLYYTVVYLVTNVEVQIDASISLKNQVSVQTLQKNINFKQEDGSDYKVVQVNETAVDYRDTMSLFVGSTVVKTDYAKFESKLTTILKEKVAATEKDAIKVKIVKQERTISSNGGFVFKLSYIAMAEDQVILPEAIEAIAPSQLKADVVVANPAGVNYELKVEAADVDTFVRESELFFNVLPSLVADSNKASLEAAIQTAWKEGKNTTLTGTNIVCKILAVLEFSTATGESFYKMAYSIKLDDTLINAMEEKNIHVDKINKEISQVDNPQGVAYGAVTVALSTLSDLAVSTSIVISSAFIETQNEDMKKAIIAAAGSTLTAAAKTNLEVNVIRQREVLDQTTKKYVYAVDYQLVIGGQVVSASVLPAPTTSLVVSTFKASTGVSLELVSVPLTKVHTVESTYSLVLNSDVDESKFDSFKTVIADTFKTQASFASAKMEVIILGTEEIIQTEKSTTQYNLRYLVQVDGALLDARVEAIASTETLSTKIATAKITNVNGEAFSIVIANTSTVENATTMAEMMTTVFARKTQCAVVTVDGKFSVGDQTALGDSVKTVITKVEHRRKRRGTSSVSKFISKTQTKITVVQQRELVDSTGKVFTSVLMRIKSGGRQVNPAIIEPIKTDKVLVELGKKSLVMSSGYKFVTKTEVKTLLETGQGFTFLLNAAVNNADTVTLENKLTATFKTRAAFSSLANFKIKVARQVEMMSVSGASSYKIFYFAMSGTTMIRSSVVKTLTTTELTTSLSFSMTGRGGVSYNQVISTDQKATSLIRLSSLHSVTLAQKIAVSSYSKFASTMVPVVAQASGLTLPTLKVVGQQEFISVTGKINYRLLFSCKAQGRLIRSVDVKAAQTAVISSALKIANVKSAKGLTLTVIDKTAVAKQVRATNLFKFTLKKKIQPYDISIIQSAMAKAYTEVNAGVSLSTVSVTIMRQSQVIDTLGGTFWKIMFSVKVNGKLKSSVTQGQISVTKVTASLTSIKMSGSGLTYGSQVVDVKSFVNFKKETLASIVVSKVVKGSVKDEIEKMLAVTLKASVASLAGQTVEVKIIKQEDIITRTGEMKIKHTFNIKVNGKVIDYRDIADVSKAALTTNIQASNILTAAGVKFEANVDINTAVSVSQAITVFVDNVISPQDVDIIMIKLKMTYKAKIAGLATAEFKFVKVSPVITAQGKSATAFKFFIKTDIGKVIQQSLSKAVLTQALSAVTTARREKLTVVEETTTSPFIDKKSCFKLVIKENIKKMDITAVEAALAEAWLKMRQDYLKLKTGGAGGQWKVHLIGQEKGVDGNGNTAVRLLYTVSSQYTTINNKNEETISSTSAKTYLNTVAKTGTNTNYGTEVLAENVADKFVAKADLCLVVVNQFVKPTLVVELNRIISTTWTTVYKQLTDVSVKIRLQEEMILKKTTQKYGLFYEVTSEPEAMACPDFRPEFLSQLQIALSSSSTPVSKLTVLTDAQRSELTTKSNSFYLLMSATINIADFSKVEAALTQAWVDANPGDTGVTVKLSIQDEMISVDGETVWKIHYFVSSASGLITPATASALTLPQLQAALSKVSIVLTQVYYSSLLVDIQPSLLYEYRSSFYIHVTANVNDAGQAAFTLALINAWSQTTFVGQDVDVLVLKQEEIVDKLGTFAIRLIYAVTVNDKVQDSRAVGQLVETAVRTYLVGQVQGPSGPYSILVSLINPVYRLNNGLKIYVDGNVPNADNVKFEAVLTQMYRMLLKGAAVEIVFRDQFIKQGRFVTALYYFVRVNGLIALPSTLPILTADVQANIKISSGANTMYKIITDLTGLYRYRYHFSVHLTRPVLTIHVNDVLTGLLDQFKLAQPDIAKDLTIHFGIQEQTFANNLTIHTGVQEEAVTLEKNMVWRFVFFLKNNNQLIQSTLFTQLTALAVKTALFIDATATEKYSDFVLEKTEVHRLTDLMFVALNSRAAALKYTAFEEGLKEAWKASGQEFAEIKVAIATQGKYVSKQGEIVYILYYKAMLGTRLLSGLDFSLPSNLLERYLKVQSPQGILYSIYTDSTATLRRYKSAFSFYLNIVVQSSDNLAILKALQTTWATARKDLTKVVAETSMEEEFLHTSGDSIYRVSYFVSAAETTVDALFDAPLSEAQVQAALDVTVSGTTTKYSQFIQRVDLTQIEAFTDLIPLPFTSMVAPADYAAIGTALQTAWRGVGDEWGDLDVSVRAQEELVDGKGHVAYALMYSITKDGKIFALEDLPRVPAEELEDIEKLPGLKGSYKLAMVKLGELRRYKVAMSVFIDKWVAYRDLNKLTLALQNTLKDVRQEYFSLRIDRATQQWFVTKEKSRVLKFVFFGYLGTRLLDGRRESSLDTASLSARFTTAGLQYEVVRAADLAGVRDLRNAYTVFIEGKVASVDMPSFTAGLKTIWQKIESKADVEIVLNKDEFIGDKQIAVTGLVFFVTVDGEIISSLSPGGPTRATIAGELMVTSQRGNTYKVYEGSVVPYKHLYSLMLVNNINLGQAAQLKSILEHVWENHLESDDIDITLTKAEKNIGSYGGYITKLLYRVKMDDEFTFPADRLPPQTDQPQSAIEIARLPGIRVFSGSAITRVDHTYQLTIEGKLNKDEGALVLAGVRRVWGQGAATDLTDPTIELIGQYARVSVSKSKVLTQVIYQVKSEGRAVAVEDLEAPSVADFESELRKADLEVYGGSTLLVRYRFLKGRVPRFSFTKAESALQAAWAASNVGKVVAVSVISHDEYINRQWSDVTNLGFTVRINDNDVDRTSVVPSDEKIEEKLKEMDLSQCGCIPKRKYQTFIYGTTIEVNFKLQQILISLRRAWAKVNPDIQESKFKLNPKPLRTRTKRDAQNNTEVEFLGPTGKPVAPVTFTIDLEGQDPDLIKVAPPDLNTVNDELRKSAGVESCGCIPLRCHILRLKGVVGPDDSPDIIKALKESYSKANPDYQEKDIHVKIKSITNDKRDPRNGIVVGEVKYCVKSDLIEPDFANLRDALKKYGKELYDGDIDILDKEDNQWIMIIGIVCGALALLFVILAIVKVCIRLRNINAETKKVDNEAGGYSTHYYLEDDAYASHGTFRRSFSKEARSDSPQFYGKGHMYDPKSYMTTPGTMLYKN